MKEPRTAFGTADVEKPSVRIGIDFGGTKIETAALLGSDLLSSRRVATPDNYRDAITVVTALIAETEGNVGKVDRIGIGLPGSVSRRSGLMRNANRTYLNGTRFGIDLANALGRKVMLSNDANCLALSEAYDGAAANCSVVFAVVIGTGVGGGLVIDGKLVEGANGIAGEWGHNALPVNAGTEPKPRPCWCGRNNCIETWVSGAAFQAIHRERGGLSVNGEQIISEMRSGDRIAAEMFDLWIDRLARSLATIVNIIDPDVIVFGGGMANISELYARLPAAMQRHVFADNWLTRLKPAKWGDASGVRGAARL